MNSKNSSIEKRDKYENEFSCFLLEKIGNAGGSLPLQHITGHMSQVRHEVRHAIGTSISGLKQYLNRHSNLFNVDNNVVSLINSSTLNTSGYDSDNSSTGLEINLPPIISKGKGVIVKLFPSYGFIKSKDPIKTEIYFNASDFGDSNTDLTSILYTGSNVYFNAKKKSRNDSRSKYYAIKVWKADNSKPEDNAIIQKSRKTRETGLYDPLTLDGEGVIQNVFPNLGFIAVNGDNNNTVFFYKSRVINYSNIVDLTKVFSKNDIVEFNAHRSTKADAKARWEATKVWKISGKVKQNACISDTSPCSNMSIQPVLHMNNKAKEMKKNQYGKISPRSHGAVIKFGKNELADGDSALYFICGAEVTDIGWEFSEGDDVAFDAVKIKSAPGWKAVLVWSGEKPDIVLPTSLGDFSEFIDEDNGDISSSIYTSKSSSCLSINSSSSLKSVSVKSEYCSKKNLTNEKSSMLPDVVVHKKVIDYKTSKIHDHSQNGCSSSTSSKNFQNLGKEKKNGSLSKFDSAVLNWGDSPYPDADLENMKLRCDEFDSQPAENIQCNITFSDEELNISKYKSSMEEYSDEEMDNCEFSTSDIKNNINESTKNIHCDITFSDEKLKVSKYKSSMEEYSEEETNNCEFSTSDIKNNINESTHNKLKEIASIKEFQNIKGKINKVYSKFAEVKSCNLQNTISFFWNDFYSNGISVEELELDDLKHILKIGDIIQFNYFIIVDDSGQSWQKVSLAWIGSKPKKTIEMKPEDFIKQNSLSVTINDEFDIDQVEEEKATYRKFLTSFIDVVPDPGNKIPKSESCTEDDESLVTVQYSKVKYSKTLQQEHFLNLSSMVCQILKKKVFSADSKVDLQSISEEIVNIVLENCNVIKSDGDSYNASNPLQVKNRDKISDICSKCRGNGISRFSSQEVTTNNCDVQTIITGEIIAQNIFTQC